MHKYEILAKSLEENGIADERERQMHYRASYFAFTAMAVAWLVLFIFKVATQQPTGDTSFLFFVGMSAMTIYQYLQTRQRIFLAGSIVTCVAAATWAISYVISVLGL